MIHEIEQTSFYSQHINQEALYAHTLKVERFSLASPSYSIIILCFGVG